LHWDTDLRGFALLCSGVTNSKTYIVQRDLPNGRARRVTLGSVNEITLRVARDRAADALDALRRGDDPKAKTNKLTLQHALDLYLAARKDLRPASVRNYKTSVETYLASWRDLPLRDITSEMVEDPAPRHRRCRCGHCARAGRCPAQLRSHRNRARRA
jgi:hypothetical protein